MVGTSVTHHIDGRKRGGEMFGIKITHQMEER